MMKLWSPVKNFFGKVFTSKSHPPEEEKKPARPREELEALIEKYKQYIIFNPTDDMAHYNLGEVYVELFRYAEAVSPLKEALRLNPKNQSAYYQLGKAFIALGRDEDAVTYLEKVYQLNSSSKVIKNLLVDAHTNLSITYGKMKRQEDSMKHFQEAVKIVPDHGRAHLSLGICYTELGRYEEALEKIKEALAMDKNLAVDAYYNFGVVCTKLGEHSKAIKYYKEAIKAAPKSALPSLNLGMLYAKLGRYKEAVHPLSEALKMSPRLVPEAHFRLGVVLMKLERYSGAVQSLRKAVKLSPKDEKVKDFLAEALYRKSISCRGSGKLTEEIKFLEEAVFFNPEHSMAHFWLGQAYDKTNDGQQAIVHTLIAKQFFVEKQNDEWIGKVLLMIPVFCKKYNCRVEDFARLDIPRKQ